MDYLVIIMFVVNLRSIFIRQFQTTTVAAFPVYHRLGERFHLAFQCRRILVSHENHFVAYTNKRRDWNAIDYQFYMRPCLSVYTRLLLLKFYSNTETQKIFVEIHITINMQIFYVYITN